MGGMVLLVLWALREAMGRSDQKESVGHQVREQVHIKETGSTYNHNIYTVVGHDRWNETAWLKSAGPPGKPGPPGTVGPTGAQGYTGPQGM